MFEDEIANRRLKIFNQGDNIRINEMREILDEY